MKGYEGKPNPFDFVRSINKGGPNLIDHGIRTENNYIPYMVNKAFSYSRDTLEYANAMNGAYSLPHKMQYDFYLNIVRPRNRFTGKWAKPPAEMERAVETIMSYFGYSRRKAYEAAELLSEEDITAIRETMKNWHGGLDNSGSD